MYVAVEIKYSKLILYYISLYCLAFKSQCSKLLVLFSF